MARFQVKNLFKIASAVFVLGASQVTFGTEITGAGASFPYPLYAKWADTYKKETGVSLNYQSIGSGGGIKQIEAKTVDFGASDKPLDEKKLKEDDLTQFPTVVGGVVPVFNLEGIKDGGVKLTGDILAQIYMGKITKWNDAAIVAINPGVSLPDKVITVVHRSDGSGTSFLFTNYLSQVNKDWKEKVGADTSVSWPAGVGGKGNEGVASYVGRIGGAIGYVEYAYAKQNKLTSAQLQNKSGKFVEPSASAFQEAAASAKWDSVPNFYLILTDVEGDKVWPIVGATFILMEKKPKNPKQIKAVLDFFRWAYEKGDALATDLDYVPLPNSVVNLIEQSWKENIALE